MSQLVSIHTAVPATSEKLECQVRSYSAVALGSAICFRFLMSNMFDPADRAGLHHEFRLQPWCVMGVYNANIAVRWKQYIKANCALNTFDLTFPGVW